MTNKSLFRRLGVPLTALSLVTAVGVPTPVGAVSPEHLISTIAGTGSAGLGGDVAAGGAPTALDTPTAIAVSTAGVTYIADSANGRVWVIAADGSQTTFAGGGSGFVEGDGATTVALSAPSGVAVDKNGVVYIADPGLDKVFIVPTSGAQANNISTLAGTGTEATSGDGSAATAADLNNPADVAVDDNLLVYISTPGSHTVRSIDVNGDITTLIGLGTPGSAGDTGTAIGAWGLSTPLGIDVDKNNVLYIADSQNHRVISVSGTDVTRLAGSGTLGSTLSAGAGGALTSGLDSPASVAVDKGGNIHVADSANNRVLKVTPTGVISVLSGDGVGTAGTAIAATHNNPTGLATDKFSNLYVIDQGTHQALKITQPDVDNPVVAITAPLDAATAEIDDVVTVDFGCTDFYSGIDTCMATLNGGDILDGEDIDTSTAGDKVLVVTATDVAGNTASTTVTITVNAGATTPDPEPDPDPAEPPSREIVGTYAGGSGDSGTISRLYMAIMKRQPEDGGHQYWEGEIDAGTKTLEEVVTFFIASPEFVTLYGDATTDEFVDLLYANVMSRAGQEDAVGQAFWRGVLTDGTWTRLQVTLYFSQSDEFKGLTGTS